MFCFPLFTISHLHTIGSWSSTRKQTIVALIYFFHLRVPISANAWYNYLVFAINGLLLFGTDWLWTAEPACIVMTKWIVMVNWLVSRSIDRPCDQCRSMIQVFRFAISDKRSCNWNHGNVLSVHANWLGLQWKEWGSCSRPLTGQCSTIIMACGDTDPVTVCRGMRGVCERRFKIP